MKMPEKNNMYCGIKVCLYYEAAITPASPRSSASYKKYAPANEYYAMTARSVGTGYHILGRYTP